MAARLSLVSFLPCSADRLALQRLAPASAAPFSFASVPGQRRSGAAGSLGAKCRHIHFLRQRFSCRDALQPGAGGASARHIFFSGGPRALPLMSRSSSLVAVSSLSAIKHEASGCSSTIQGKIAERVGP